ncbi:DUF2087 domain-containing protein [Neomicrococcus aestuarii]|uniref:DUF2087 domain-containing protein n=1 Tax=Neomicrococcus aestuarii TaxID=556325 RepID=A0A1L2ZNX4_9MICC|nr:DUF2087 domain-containing protein [Neomicrococcus aestuarii]APF41054.1 hypothetical protein BHE16_08645 [Neomicrococcus aestuarii]
MSSPLPNQDAEALKRARMIVAALASSTLRRPLLRDIMEAREEPRLDPHRDPTENTAQNTAKDTADSSRSKRAQYDWLARGIINEPLLRETSTQLKNLLSEDLILRVGRLDQLPAKEPERITQSQLIIRTVFERVKPRKFLTEPELNAGLAMFVEDVALVRRDGVDSGFLDRSSDGARYALRA